MAVPKKKKSRSRSKMRRGSNGSFDANFPNVTVDKSTGEFKLPHHISVDGYYNGKKVVANKQKKAAKEE
jgi:large subunit ribosomal protein L32